MNGHICLSSRLMTPLTEWRNTRGKESQWHDYNAHQDNTVRSLFAAGAYLGLAGLATIEAGLYLLSLLIPMRATSSIQRNVEHLNSAKFTVVWALFSASAGHIFPNLHTKEEYARWWASKSGFKIGNGPRACPPNVSGPAERTSVYVLSQLAAAAA